MKNQKDPASRSKSIKPHFASSWVDYLEGDEPVWSTVLSAWFTFSTGSTNKMAAITGDLLLAIRSDLTIFLGIKGWSFSSMKSAMKKSQGKDPFIQAVVYLNLKRQHYLATFITDPAAMVPEGIPEFLVKSFITQPFNITLEAMLGLFRLDLISFS